MKKITTCQCCEQETMISYICDSCGANLLEKYLGVPISIAFGYGHGLDLEEYHFCDNGCAIEFLTKESEKERAS
jgi:hypothetical protein